MLGKIISTTAVLTFVGLSGYNLGVIVTRERDVNYFLRIADDYKKNMMDLLEKSETKCDDLVTEKEKIIEGLEARIKELEIQLRAET